MSKTIMKRRTQMNNIIHQIQNDEYRCNRWYSTRSKYFHNRFDKSSTLFCQDAKGHSGCVNALDFSNDGLLLASGGDDKRILLWNTAETIFTKNHQLPIALHATHLSNIFSVKFDNHNRRIISAGNDEQILVHDIEKQQQRTNSVQSDELVDVFLETSPVNCLSVQPNENNTFIAATEDGHVHLYDCRVGSTSSNYDQPSIIVAESFDGSFHSCAFHPQQTSLVATANARQGIELYDIRLSKSAVLRYGAPTASSRETTSTSAELEIEGMSVTFNTTGSLLYALRRRLPPALFTLHQSKPFCQFDADDYVNLCTMKGGCFLGDHDQYIASGSDDFNVYIWRIPDNNDYQTIDCRPPSYLNSDHFVWNAHMILSGHRSVVNQVRYSSRLHTLATSGVEKMIKIWTPYSTKNQSQYQQKFVGRQEMYTHRDYLRALLESGSVHHDSSIERFDEDKRMLAFFDSLLQRELTMLNGEFDDSDDESDDESSTSSSGSSSSSSSSRIDSEENQSLDILENETNRNEQTNRNPNQHPPDSNSRASTSQLNVQTRHPTISSLARNYRVQYQKMLKEKNINISSTPEKRTLDLPSTNTPKRHCSSLSYDDTLRNLRNRIRDEDNEQFCFNDERRM